MRHASRPHQTTHSPDPPFLRRRVPCDMDEHQRNAHLSLPRGTVSSRCRSLDGLRCYNAIRIRRVAEINYWNRNLLARELGAFFLLFYFSVPFTLRSF